MPTSQKQRDAKLREDFLADLTKILAEHDPEMEILRTGSGSIDIPVLDAEQNERYIKIVVQVPTGAQHGDGYDGHAVAASFEFEQKQKQADAEQRAKDKAKKIARDEQLRAEKRAAKESAKEQE